MDFKCDELISEKTDADSREFTERVDGMAALMATMNVKGSVFPWLP